MSHCSPGFKFPSISLRLPSKSLDRCVSHQARLFLQTFKDCKVKAFMNLEFELHPAHSRCSIKFCNHSRDLAVSWHARASAGNVFLQEESAYYSSRLSFGFYYFLGMSVKPAGLRRLFSVLLRCLYFKDIRGRLEF